jgi:hypothetical protein
MSSAYETDALPCELDRQVVGERFELSLFRFVGPVPYRLGDPTIVRPLCSTPCAVLRGARWHLAQEPRVGIEPTPSAWKAEIIAARPAGQRAGSGNRTRNLWFTGPAHRQSCAMPAKQTARCHLAPQSSQDASWQQTLAGCTMRQSCLISWRKMVSCAERVVGLEPTTSWFVVRCAYSNCATPA